MECHVERGFLLLTPDIVPVGLAGITITVERKMQAVHNFTFGLGTGGLTLTCNTFSHTHNIPVFNPIDIFTHIYTNTRSKCYKFHDLCQGWLYIYNMWVQVAKHF